MTIDFNGQVAIVTGAGNGLGRSHALAMAKRGAKVVVNELDEASKSAEQVVIDIEKAGGEAIIGCANVTQEKEVQRMVDEALSRWGRVDILVNNAGILRDKSFSKMSLDDFRLVLDVHLMGSVICTKSVWDVMKEQRYGRVVMTTSSSSLYGNFGQSNYAASKMGLIGFMNSLHLEGLKYGIHVNALSPTADTRMTAGVMDAEMRALMTPESVSAALLYLVSEEAPKRTIICACAGGYSTSRIYETPGIFLPKNEQTPDHIAANFEEILNPEGQEVFSEARQQTLKFLDKATNAIAKH